MPGEFTGNILLYLGKDKDDNKDKNDKIAVSSAVPMQSATTHLNVYQNNKNNKSDHDNHQNYMLTDLAYSRLSEKMMKLMPEAEQFEQNLQKYGHDSDEKKYFLDLGERATKHPLGVRLIETLKVSSVRLAILSLIVVGALPTLAQQGNESSTGDVYGFCNPDTGQNCSDEEYTKYICKIFGFVITGGVCLGATITFFMRNYCPEYLNDPCRVAEPGQRAEGRAHLLASESTSGRPSPSSPSMLRDDEVTNAIGDKDVKNGTRGSGQAAIVRASAHASTAILSVNPEQSTKKQNNETGGPEKTGEHGKNAKNSGIAGNAVKIQTSQSTASQNDSSTTSAASIAGAPILISFATTTQEQHPPNMIAMTPVTALPTASNVTASTASVAAAALASPTVSEKKTTKPSS